ncbi:MAG: histidine phosphatase family protein [Candidatus Izemoplasmatales bacterium]
MTQLIMIRHGQTDANKQFLIQGRTDNPLNITGIKQARQTAMYLKTHGYEFDNIYSSPLKRSVLTAQTIVDVINPNLKIIIHQCLRERDFGDFEGRVIDQTYYDMVNNNIIPNMEKNGALEERVSLTLKEIAIKNPHKRILIATHSHVIKAMFVNLVDGFQYSSLLPNCAINILEYDSDSFRVIQHNLDPLKIATHN